VFARRAQASYRTGSWRRGACRRILSRPTRAYWHQCTSRVASSLPVFRQIMTWPARHWIALARSDGRADGPMTECGARPWTGFVFAYFSWRQSTRFFRACRSAVVRWFRSLQIVVAAAAGSFPHICLARGRPAGFAPPCLPDTSAMGLFLALHCVREIGFDPALPRESATVALFWTPLRCTPTW
jgi:hypothetical protein